MSYQPITWRNVNAPSNAAANDLLVSAGDSIEKMFSGLGQTVKGVQNDRATEYKHNVDQNTQAALDIVQQLKDPNNTQATQANLDAFLQSLNGVYDKNKLRGAVDNRGQFLKQQILTNNQFERDQQTHADWETNITNRPFIGEIDSLEAQFKFDAAREAINNSPLSEREKAIQLRELTQAEDANRKRTAEIGATDFRTKSNTVLNSAVERFNSLHTDANKVIEAKKKELGITDISKATPEQLAALKPVLDANQPISATQFSQQLMQELANDPNSKYANAGWQANSSAWLDQALSGTLQLSSYDNALLEQDRDKLKTAYAEVLDGNIFAEPSQKYAGNHQENLEQILEDNKGTLGDLYTSNKQDIITGGLEALAKGYHTTTDGETFRVTPELIAIAIKSMDSSMFGSFSSENFPDALENVLGNANMAKQYEEYQQYKQEDTNLVNAHKGNALRGNPTQEYRNFVNQYRGRKAATDKQQILEREAARIKAEKQAAAEAEQARIQAEKNLEIDGYARKVIESRPKTNAEPVRDALAEQAAVAQRLAEQRRILFGR